VNELLEVVYGFRVTLPPKTGEWDSKTETGESGALKPNPSRVKPLTEEFR
jgi:hypothetical protein